MTDALDKAAATLDDAAGSAATAADSATAATAKAADTVKSGTAKAADTVKSGTVKAADTVKAGAGKAVDPDEGTGSETPPPRSMDEIEAELDATRERLAGRIDDLTDYVKPAHVLERQKAKLKSVFVDEYGGIKPDRVLIAAGVVVAIIGLGVLKRRRRRG